VVLFAVTLCEHAPAQNSAPEAAPAVAIGPHRSDSPSEPVAQPPAATSEASVDGVKTSAKGLKTSADEVKTSANEVKTSADEVKTPVDEMNTPVDEVKAYLWSVYQRSPAKTDGHGEFTWKDVSAAVRSGLSVEDYVIGGIDPDFRELLFTIGHAMDTAGVEWTILSGFRDDFRQNLASGLKARVNNSFHGGSEATGGYGHGCAVDLASADRMSDDKVWNWLDRKGREFDLYRPLRAADPAHVIPLAGWHELGALLRDKRLGIPPEADPMPLADLVTVQQYLCVRPLPPEKPAGGAAVADNANNKNANYKTAGATHAARHDTNAKSTGAPQKLAGAQQKPNSVHEAKTTQPVRAASKAVHGDRPRPQ
jgi:hypothetical protein